MQQKTEDLLRFLLNITLDTNLFCVCGCVCEVRWWCGGCLLISVRKIQHSCHQFVQEKSPTGSFFVVRFCFHAAPSWMKFWGMKESLTRGLLSLFFFNKPVSNGCCHTWLLQLNRRNITVLLISLVASGATWLLFFSSLFLIYLFFCINSANCAANIKSSVLN